MTSLQLTHCYHYLHITHLFFYLLELQMQESQQEESNNSLDHLKNYFFEEYDSSNNQNRRFVNKSTFQEARHKPNSAAFPSRQGLNFNSSNKSIKSENHCSLFYKLSHEIFEQEDKAANQEKQQKNKSKNLKNQTKNIPKNFGKGIINFLQKHEKKVKQLIKQNGLGYCEFFSMIRNQKKTINTIADLRRLWTHEKFGRVLRILSNLFLRQYALEYIFNSRISNYSTHIKYRHMLWSALKNPENFNHIKQY